MLPERLRHLRASARLPRKLDQRRNRPDISHALEPLHPAVDHDADDGTVTDLLAPHELQRDLAAGLEHLDQTGSVLALATHDQGLVHGRSVPQTATPAYLAAGSSNGDRRG